MAIRYVDIEPEGGKAKLAKAPPKPVSPTSDAAQAADETPAPATKPRRRRRVAASPLSSPAGDFRANHLPPGTF